jgi:KDO2-lipid IV(A) lauroyltransferase
MYVRYLSGSHFSMLLFVLRLLACLPLSWLHAIGRGLGRAVYAVPGRYRDRLRRNAALAGYDEPGFAWRAAAQAGAMILEIPKVWLRTAQCMALTQSGDDACVREALAGGRSVLCLTPHLGSFEIVGRRYSQYGPMTVMFRPARKALLNPVMEQARGTAKMRAVPATMQGVREFVRALKRGEIVGMLPDQAPSEGDGVWAPFFGKPAYTMTLAGKLARQPGVAAIVCAAERLPRGQGWRMHHLPLPQPLPEDAAELAALLNAHMETLIRRFPEQYLWSYNRYKTPAGATPPPSDT